MHRVEGEDERASGGRERSGAKHLDANGSNSDFISRVFPFSSYLTIFFYYILSWRVLFLTGRKAKDLARKFPLGGRRRRRRCRCRRSLEHHSILLTTTHAHTHTHALVIITIIITITTTTITIIIIVIVIIRRSIVRRTRGRRRRFIIYCTCVSACLLACVLAYLIASLSLSPPSPISHLSLSLSSLSIATGQWMYVQLAGANDERNNKRRWGQEQN